MPQPRGQRVASLDLIRGVAVLGILAINIAGFAGPAGATLSPHVPAPGSFADELAYAAAMVLFEGKMRALFTILFGASMLLLIARAEAAGRDGDALQLRRLGWLALFGWLHFALFWWGDILFSYGLIGILALFLRELRTRTLLAVALLIFSTWHLTGAAMSLPQVRVEERVRIGTATPAEMRSQAAVERRIARDAEQELAEYRGGFAKQIAAKLERRPLWQFKSTFANAGETLPLMLIGMVLFRSGFFAGRWPRPKLRRFAALCALGGLVPTVALVAWLWQRHFPPQAMSAALLYWLAVPHLLMSLGYAAMLVLATPRLAATRLGERLCAAGRMAFSNYLGTTVLMTALFYGWGLGLIGTVARTEQPAFVLLAWALMLAWSKPWLLRFRHGPLEWLWRSLVEKRLIPLRK